MKNDVKIKGDNTLVKRNGGVINKDKSAYEQVKRQKKRQLEIDDVIKKSNELEQRMIGIETSINAILTLLQQGK